MFAGQPIVAWHPIFAEYPTFAGRQVSVGHTRSLPRHLILDERYADRRVDTEYLRDIRSSQDTTR